MEHPIGMLLLSSLLSSEDDGIFLQEMTQDMFIPATASQCSTQSITLSAGTCLLPIPWVQKLPDDIPKRFGGKNLSPGDIIKLRYKGRKN